MVVKILVSNDDGVKAPGIDSLAHYATELGEVIIIAPDSQRSAGGKSLTFHKPLRINKATTLSGFKAYSMNGSPADSIILYHHLFEKDPDIVISGINSGENASLHSILTSGTCAVALEAGLRGVPSFALSIDVPEEMFFKPNKETKYDIAAKQGIKIIKKLLKLPEDYWDKVLFVNINFPRNVNNKTKIEVAPPAKYKYENFLVERIDPRGEKYYWLWGELRKDLDPGTDAFLVLKNNTITVTPITFGMGKELEELTKNALKENTGE